MCHTRVHALPISHGVASMSTGLGHATPLHNVVRARFNIATWTRLVDGAKVHVSVPDYSLHPTNNYISLTSMIHI